MKKFFILVLLFIFLSSTVNGEDTVIKINAGNVIAEADRRLLVGNNIALWWEAKRYEDPLVESLVKDLSPTIMRLPGGSWGDVIWWNGNGIRKPGIHKLDTSKFSPKPYSEWSAPFGVWQVDYSAYAPGFFSINGKDEGWHGHIDVKFAHDWIKKVGCDAFVIVNAGQGTPKDAAEWAKWAKKEGYPVKYWEVGNELGGSWEAGNLLPDGTRLNGHIYARRYKEFAEAIKKVDPNAKVGCMDWVEDVLSYCGDLVDFVSIHTYPVNGSENNSELFQKVFIVEKEVTPVKELIKKYQPDRADEIEIGYTEWNIHQPDTRNALWYGMFLGEMMKNGVDFSTHFQLFDTILQGNPTVRRVDYLSFWLWRHVMGNKLVKTRVMQNKKVFTYSTLTDDGLSVMVFNTDYDNPVDITLEIDEFKPAKKAQVLTLSRREHLWLDKRPDLKPWEQGRYVECMVPAENSFRGHTSRRMDHCL